MAPGAAPSPAAHAPPHGGALRFTTLAEIASGDTARIDLCRVTEPDVVRGRLVATKRLHVHLLADRELASMFFDEVWMTASLRHPNVVEVVGWGADEEGPFLAVELVEGVSLARLTKTVFDTGEIFGERMVVYVGSQICRGLAAAHEIRAPNGEQLGLVHRDLTPGNVLVGFEGRVKITDFGLAKAKQRITKTVTGLLKGRPQYMAPEQARGDAVDARADLFSLGVVLFELFAGRRPWSGATEFEVLSTTQNDPPADLRELRPKIDRELASLVMRLLEKSPGDRYPSAAEVGIRLDEWLAVHGWSEGNDEALARFVRRNAMRQMRWFERAIKGELPAPRRKARGGSIPSLPETRPSRRERAKRVGGEDETEISHAAADASRFDNPQRQETVASSLDIIESTPAVGRALAGLHDFGEEVPTLVHRGERPLTPGLPGAPSVAPPRYDPADYGILEEDTDQRTTAVKGRSPAAGMPLHAPSRQGVEEDIADPETETIPVKGPRQAAVVAALDAARISALPPARPPPRPVGGPASVAPPAAAPPASAPTSRGVAPSPPQRQGSTPPPPSSGPPTHSSPAESPPHGPWTTERVVELADRIAGLAVAAEEDARAAAATAAHKAAVARRIAEAASHVSHAARSAAAGGDLVASVRAAEEAERAVVAAQRSDPEPPPPGRHPSFLSLPPPGRAEPAPGFPPPAPAHHQAVAPTLLGHDPYDPARLAARVDPYRGGAGASALTALSIRLRPLFLGLPPAMAVTIVVLAVLAIMLLILVISG